MIEKIKKYGCEVVFFKKIRKLSDGIIFFTLNINLDLFKADHNPKFNFIIIFLNFTIIEFNVFSTDHVISEKNKQETNKIEQVKRFFPIFLKECDGCCREFRLEAGWKKFVKTYFWQDWRYFCKNCKPD